MIKLYQIRIGAQIARRVNAGESVPQYNAHLDATHGKFPGREFYSHVADLFTNDLEDAFRIGNVGEPHEHLSHAPMHSVSVGDVLVREDGSAHIVASFGFEQVADWSEIAAEAAAEQATPGIRW